MPHVATCSGSNSSNAHVNVNLVNATKHSTATAATTRNNNEWNNSIGHCCGNLPAPLLLPPPLGLATPPWPAWFHMCFYVNFHEISWQHDELPALPPCGTNTPISRRRESGNTTAVTCRNLRDGNQQSGEGGEAAMPNAQLTPCQSSFRCRCARLIRSRKCRDPIGDLAGNEAEHVVEALSVPPLPGGATPRAQP